MKKMKYIFNLVVFTMFAQIFASPDWEYDAGAWEFTAWMTTSVSNESGEALNSEGDILAAFDDAGNVRGVAVQVVPNFGPYAGVTLFEITMGSNSNGDEISFQFYDASDDVVLSISETYSFTANESTGDWFSPGSLTASLSYPTAPACEDNDAGVAPFTCADAIAQFGCDFLWGGVPISDSCPETCDSCPEYNEGCMDSSAANYDDGVEYHDADSCQYCEDDDAGVAPFTCAEAIAQFGCDYIWGDSLIGDSCVASCNEACASCDDADDDGVCDDVDDCVGAYDECGVCNGGNADMDECGECFGSGYADNCGTCDDDASNDCTQDCNGDWGGTAELDDCGVCDGDNSSCEPSDCVSDPSTWVVNPPDFENNGSVTAAVYINDNMVGGSEDLLAGFVGDELRGVQNGLLFPPTNYNVFNLMLFSNEPSGETITFKYYHANTDQVYCLNETLDFVSDMTVGNAFTPFEFFIEDDSWGGAEGCVDDSACNYDADATAECDNCCEYPEENYDCAGNCIVDVDCAGECGGTAELDDCGICEGDNSTCTGCTDSEAVNFDPEAIISCDDCCDYTFTQELALDMAANLVSFNVLPEEPTIVNILEPIAGNVFSVIGESNATQYTDDGLWIGSLTSVDQWSGYWLLLNESDVLTIEGNPTDPGEYELQYGANLLSYPFNVSSAIQDALPSDVVGTIYSVMSQNEVSILIDGDWVGSLTHFIPGNGYWFKSNEDISFSYNAPSFSRSKVEKTVPSGFEVAQSSKRAFYMIESIDIAEEGDWIVAYNGDVIVGIREWNGNNTDVPSMGSDNQFYSVGYCTEGETPSFKLIKETTGELIDLVGNVPSWENNTVLFVNSLTDEANTLPYDVNLNSVYPNPFNPVTTIHYSTETQSRVSLQIYNVQGQLVETLVDGLVDAGYYEMMWDAKLQPSGIYFVRLQSASSMQIQKIMLLK